jgi:hypothetical protein
LIDPPRADAAVRLSGKFGEIVGVPSVDPEMAGIFEPAGAFGPREIIPPPILPEIEIPVDGAVKILPPRAKRVPKPKKVKKP